MAISRRASRPLLRKAPFRRLEQFNQRRFDRRHRAAFRRAARVFVRQILPNRIQAAFEGGPQRVVVALEQLPRQIEPSAAEEEIFYLLIRVFNTVLFGGHRPHDIEFVEPPTLEDVSPEVAMCWPDSWPAMEPFSRGLQAIISYAEMNFDNQAMLNALGILEWVNSHYPRIDFSSGLFIWMLLTEEDAVETTGAISRCLHSYDNNNLDFMTEGGGGLPMNWMISYGNN